ncbi:DUF1643 domain-containing protein [Nonomuraea sp. MTCD27]|uniref:DUF1643 domain-containing protein n=1 Tax=Nonomuraea sp. MTCD27 TaxID=1676747 RepID=UPI0035BF6F57
MTLAQEPLFADDTASGAVIDGPYRYTLWRTWDGRLPVCGWVMLNPSTADACADDPTIRRCVGFARRWGFGGIVVRNLFAFRATSPRQLLDAADPVGPDNEEWLSRWDGVTGVVAAWGTGRWPRLAGDRWRRAAALLAPLGPVCLRAARDGQPVHPLYQPAHLEPIPWSVP